MFNDAILDIIFHNTNYAINYILKLEHTYYRTTPTQGQKLHFITIQSTTYENKWAICYISVKF